MLEAARLVAPLFALNTILDTSHNLIRAFAGDVELSHEAGCARAAKIFKTELRAPLDAVITSAGGRPYDCNFMQALKAVFDVQEIVRPGGAILWIAECAGGMKKEFLRWGRIKSEEALESSVRSDYDLAGHNTVMLRKLTGRVRVALLSALPDEEVSTMGLQPVHSLQEGLDWLLDGFRSNFRYALVPFGNVTYATVGR
jgi:nickel-dependent lactate racemase